MIEKIQLLFFAMRDQRTPWYAKAIVILALAYIISPIDLIPDFIPVIGLLDEVILIPIIYSVAMKLVPDMVKTDAVTMTDGKETGYVIKILGIVIVILIWLVLIFITYSIVN